MLQSMLLLLLSLLLLVLLPVAKYSQEEDNDEEGGPFRVSQSQTSWSWAEARAFGLSLFQASYKCVYMCICDLNMSCAFAKRQIDRAIANLPNERVGLPLH